MRLQPRSLQPIASDTRLYLKFLTLNWSEVEHAWRQSSKRPAMHADLPSARSVESSEKIVRERIHNLLYRCRDVFCQRSEAGMALIP